MHGHYVILKPSSNLSTAPRRCRHRSERVPCRNPNHHGGGHRPLPRGHRQRRHPAPQGWLIRLKRYRNLGASQEFVLGDKRAGDGGILSEV